MVACIIVLGGGRIEVAAYHEYLRSGKHQSFSCGYSLPSRAHIHKT